MASNKTTTTTKKRTTGEAPATIRAAASAASKTATKAATWALTAFTPTKAPLQPSVNGGSSVRSAPPAKPASVMKTLVRKAPAPSRPAPPSEEPAPPKAAVAMKAAAKPAPPSEGSAPPKAAIAMKAAVKPAPPLENSAPLKAAIKNGAKPALNSGVKKMDDAAAGLPGQAVGKKQAVAISLIERDVQDPPASTSYEYVAPVVELVRPSNQLSLAERDLAEELARTLTAAKAGVARSLVRYNLTERSYRGEPLVEQFMVHYACDGWLLHKDSEEGRALAMAHAHADEADAAAALMEASAQEASSGPEAEGPSSHSKRLRNQFNFSERGAQTAHFAPRERSTATEVPATAEASGGCTQWGIYDAYIADQTQQRAQEEAQRQKLTQKGTNAEAEPSHQSTEQKDPLAVMETDKLQKALKVLERMSSQNTLLEISLDFKYWDDEADAIRTEEGTLLPLWKYVTAQAKNKQITAVSWSCEYGDLFVAAFGSFDFQKQVPGMVAGFSLKNPSFPEFFFSTRIGVTSLQLHPHHPNLLAVGCYDGSVAVYDVRAKPSSPPLFSSALLSGRHTRPVWSVVWQPGTPSMKPALYSLSSDGRVTLWTLATAEMTYQNIIKLRQAQADGSRPDDNDAHPLLAAGCCMDFHPVQEHILIVGTEEGTIYKCSTAYSAEYLLTYEGHGMSVYSVQWNPHHPGTFLSSSADWTVKLWNADSRTAVMTFGLGSPVGDVGWSPLSATIFAAVTDDGRVRVYDLNKNAAEPLCEQKVVHKARLTRLAFNNMHPVLLVGDDRGCLTTLKLSPNLRGLGKTEISEGRRELEIAKLDRVMQVSLKSAAAAAMAPAL